MVTKAKTPVKAPVKKKAPAKAMAKAGGKAKGDIFECELCGLVVSVEEPCGCGEMCEIICCGEPMKKAKAKKAPAKAKVKAK